jgi:hypothetical protein
MDVVRLPKRMNKDDLLYIQAKEQMSASFKVDYSPINQLLGIRRLRVIGHTNEAIGTLLQMKTREIERMFHKIDLIDEFLEYRNLEMHYGIIEHYNIIDHFSELQFMLERHESHSNSVGLELKEKKDKLKYLMFKWLRNNIDEDMVKEGCTMGTREVIRRLRYMVEDTKYDEDIKRVLSAGEERRDKILVDSIMKRNQIRIIEDRNSEKIIIKANKINEIIRDLRSKYNDHNDYELENLLAILEISRQNLEEIIAEITEHTK